MHDEAGLSCAQVGRARSVAKAIIGKTVLFARAAGMHRAIAQSLGDEEPEAGVHKLPISRGSAQCKMKGMSTSELPAQLRDAASLQPVDAGDIVFRQGSLASAVFLVRAGAVRLVRYGRSGNEVVLHEARAGEFFAEASLDSSRYHCDAVVTASGELMRIPAERLRALLESDAPFARQWASLLARQLRAARARLERLSLKTASERIQHLLVSEGRGQACEVTLDGTLKDLARRLGLTHESLYRTLARMESNGTVERGEGFIRLR